MRKRNAMTPYYADDWLTVYAGDCREVLPTLTAESVDCIVTSPPYWGLRDYGTATWSGGDGECDHTPDAETLERQNGRASTLVGSTTHQKAAAVARHRCKCGATRQDAQLGLEATPELYVANLVAVFGELRRVLKPSGTCWLNLGDSYNNRTKVRTTSHQPALNGFQDDNWAERAARGGVRMTQPGVKEKDLVGIPWRVAFALQADGWYLRSDIIWSKPNPMPESVTDRPTKAHEYLFLLTKSARYFYDQEAVREPLKPGADHDRPVSLREDHRGFTSKGEDVDHVMRSNPAGRNLRSVWTIATRPYPGAHFAVFPPELPERCIKAGSSERGVCPECGKPWERVQEVVGFDRQRWAPGEDQYHTQSKGKHGSTSSFTTGDVAVRETTGWRPSCSHDDLGHRWTWIGVERDANGVPLDEILEFTGCGRCGALRETEEPCPPRSATILDPFAGSGTVGLVAQKLSRRAILIDLNPDYISQQMKRNAQTPLGLPA